ncbi:hypothetical protein [Chelativorans sp. ZYF759]|uniref:hypothetical protein n=1 Tax=Chelativorans sp. ZYF759 TaxID=2692213 RepID=UPI001FF04148|nr:hypothetical protein [Chelativorans sp. ZYF759]
MAKTNDKRTASGLGTFGLRVFNKLFQRSTIARTYKDVAGLSQQIRRIESRPSRQLRLMDGQERPLAFS